MSAVEKISPDNCYAEKARNWLWVLGIIVFGATVYVIVTFSGQNRVDSSIGLSSPQQVQVQNIAFARCPYCPSFLDAQGRCNVPECPIYGPNWGMTSKRQSSALGQVLIKELALEVKPSDGSAGVAIHAI